MTTKSGHRLCKFWPKRSRATPYGAGWKYCRVCDRVTMYQGRQCPCCRLKLRTRAVRSRQIKRREAARA